MLRLVALVVCALVALLAGGSDVQAQQKPGNDAVVAEIRSLLDQQAAAWNRGDVDSLAPMLEQMRVNSPLGYHLMFRERNRRWAGWIANRLETPGTVFVAVGAGHLTGPDSVQHKLADRNIRSARLN